MNPNEFIEWVQQQLENAIGHRNYGSNTKEENKRLDGKIEAFKEVLDKVNE